MAKRVSPLDASGLVHEIETVFAFSSPRRWIYATPYDTRAPNSDVVASIDDRSFPKKPKLPEPSLSSIARSSLGKYLSATGLILTALYASRLQADSEQDAQEFFEKFCSNCHDNGAREGGLDQITNLNSLVARRYVRPGNPDDSLIFRRVQQGEMPPSQAFDFPNATDVAALRRWIVELPSSSPTRNFISESALLDDTLSFLRSESSTDRPFYRFLSLLPLYNSGVQDDALKSYQTAVNLLLNSLSYDPRLTPTQLVARNGILLAFDLRRLAWRSADWEKLVAANPYRCAPSSTAPKQNAARQFASSTSWSCS